MFVSLIQHVLQENNTVIQKGFECESEQFRIYIASEIKKTGSDCDMCYNLYDCSGLSVNNSAKSCTISKQDKCVSECQYYWYYYNTTFWNKNDQNFCTLNQTCQYAKNKEGTKLPVLNATTKECMKQDQCKSEEGFNYPDLVDQNQKLVVCTEEDSNYGCDYMYVKTDDANFKDYKYWDQYNNICVKSCPKYWNFYGGQSYYNCLSHCQGYKNMQGQSVQYIQGNQCVVQCDNNVKWIQKDDGKECQATTYCPEGYQVGSNTNECVEESSSSNSTIGDINNRPSGYHDCQLTITLNSSYYIKKTLRSKYDCIEIPSQYEEDARYIIQQKSGNDIESVSGYLPKVYFQRDICEKLEKRSCYQISDQDVYFYDQQYYYGNLNGQSSDFQKDQWFDHWNYIADEDSQVKNDCVLNISLSSGQLLKKTLRSSYECITIQSKNLEEAREIIQSKIYDYTITQVQGQIPRVYFAKNLCEKVENHWCMDSGVNQLVEFFDQYYTDEQLNRQSEYFEQDQWFSPWRYVYDPSPQQNTTTNVTIPPTPSGYYDCQMNIVIDEQTVLKKTLRSKYQCITIQEENLEEARQIIQSRFQGYTIQSVSGQIPRVYFQQDLCEKVEKHQCKDSGSDQSVEFFDQLYQNDQLVEHSNDFQEDELFQPWRYIIEKSQSDDDSNNDNANQTIIIAACSAVGGVIIIVLIVATVLICKNKKQKEQLNYDKTQNQNINFNRLSSKQGIQLKPLQAQVNQGNNIIEQLEKEEDQQVWKNQTVSQEISNLQDSDMNKQEQQKQIDQIKMQ